MSRLYKLTLIISCLFLVSCSNISNPLGRTPIETSRQPVALEQVVWRIVEVDNTTYYALDLENFETLSVNMEIIQGELFLYGQTIDELQIYYNKPQK